MTDKTIVGWDASPQSEAALDWAIRRESSRSGAISLVFAVDSPVEKLSHEARAALRDAAARAHEAAPGCLVTTIVAHGDPEDALLEYVNDKWVVAVGGGRGAATARRAGRSIGARLAAAARGPVAIIPQTADANSSGVVVGYDGSSEADAAAAFAAAEAERGGDALTLVHAWNEPVLMEGQPILDDQFIEALGDESGRILSTAAAELAEHFPDLIIRTRSVHGQPHMVLEYESRTAREIVVGSRGLRRLPRLLLGSVSGDVVSRAACPVIVVGHKPGPWYLPAHHDVASALAASAPSER
jgi:nucleotide-binding universal stress UspA family protein